MDRPAHAAALHLRCPAPWFVALLGLLGALSACQQQGMPGTATALAPPQCLPGERGFLRAKLRGAIEAEPDWHGAGLQCEGGARPDGSGVRVSFLGPADLEGRHLRLVFGIDAKPGVGTSRAVPTNVTIIVEGQ